MATVYPLNASSNDEKCVQLRHGVNVDRVVASLTQTDDDATDKTDDDEGDDEELIFPDESLADSDALFRSLSPLINSMKVFGLYFHKRRTPEVLSEIPDDTKGVENEVGCGHRWHRTWSVGCIYSLAVLVSLWVNVLRFLSVFELLVTVCSRAIAFLIVSLVN